MADDEAWFTSGIKGFAFGEFEDARDQLRSLKLDDVVSVDSFASYGSDKATLNDIFDDNSSKPAQKPSQQPPPTVSGSSGATPGNAKQSPAEAEPRKLQKPKFLRRVIIYGANKRVEFDSRQVANALFNDEAVYGLDTFKSVSDKRDLLEDALRTRDSSVILRILIHLRKTTRAKVLRNDVLVPILTGTSVQSVEVQLLIRCATAYFRKFAAYFENVPLTLECLNDLIPMGNLSIFADCENLYLFEKLADMLTSPTSTCTSKRMALKNLLITFPNDAESGWRRLATAAAHRELQVLDVTACVQQVFFAARNQAKSSTTQTMPANLDWLTHLAARFFVDLDVSSSDATPSPQLGAKSDSLKKTLPSVTQAQLAATQQAITNGGLSPLSLLHAATLMQCTNALQSQYSELVELVKMLMDNVGLKELLVAKIDSCARTRCYSELDSLIQQATKTSFGGLQKALIAPATILCLLSSARVEADVLARQFRIIENVAERRALALRLHCDRVLIDQLIEARDRRSLEQLAVRLNPRSADYSYVLEILHRDASKWKP